VNAAARSILEVAEGGVPFLIVPGNHERSKIPDFLFLEHPNIHVFERPKTFYFSKRGLSVSFSGFPYEPKNVRHSFHSLLRETGFRESQTDISLLCIHQIVEGAQIGLHNYTFRSNHDVIRGRDIPGGFAAVLSGHIHRAQFLTCDLRGVPLATSVYYSGSIERTSFAERCEKKGYLILTAASTGKNGGKVLSHNFVTLPARPMFDVTIDVKRKDPRNIEDTIKKRISQLDPEGIVRVKLQGPITAENRYILNAPYLRSLAPPTMNINLAIDFSSRRKPSH
jgi:DNA repair exonuclease SbcCD nuclease subunit